MIGSFSELFESVWAALQPAKRRKKTLRHRAKLALEALEGRYLLAGDTWLWVASQDADWNADPDYWRHTVNNNQGIPAEGDHLLFNPDMTIAGKEGSNKTCIYDGGALALASVSFSPNSLATLRLAAATDVITITDNVTMAYGTVDGLGDIRFANNTTFNWTGGLINAGIDLGVEGVTNVTTTISGDSTKSIGSAGFIFNAGTITWEGEGDIFMEPSSNIWNIGTFDIQTDADIKIGFAGGEGSVMNGGTFKKTWGADTTEIASNFQNTGTFSLGFGVVKFTGSAEQYGGLTRLNSGSLETTSTYYVAAGTLEGVGTIWGNVALYNPSNPQLGGELKPGLGSGWGTINIVGDFTMGINGILGINIDAAGNTGLLRVQPDAQGQGGVATLDGILWVNRHPDYKPEVVGTTLTFLEYISVTGDFFHIEIFDNSWTVGELIQQLRHFEADKQATSYRLVVAAG